MKRDKYLITIFYFISGKILDRANRVSHSFDMQSWKPHNLHHTQCLNKVVYMSSKILQFVVGSRDLSQAEKKSYFCYKLRNFTKWQVWPFWARILWNCSACNSSNFWPRFYIVVLGIAFFPIFFYFPFLFGPSYLDFYFSFLFGLLFLLNLL